MNSSVLPEQLLLRLQLLAPDHYQDILSGFEQQRVVSFRVNTLKGEVAAVSQDLKNAGYPLHQLKWWPAAFFVTDQEKQQIFHQDYIDGKLYVQGLSSMLPPLILDPQLNDFILDLTAAPGSKTTQIAQLLNNTGHIIANDLSPIRIFKLQANLKQQGVTNTLTKRGPGEALWRKFPEQFDRVLVDVPCTMEGRISVSDPKTYDDWSLKKIKELSTRQKMLIRAAISAAKPGATIVYSTCTLAPEENEGVVSWLLEKEQGKVVVEEISLPHLGEDTQELITGGVTSWQGEQYDPQVAKTLRIYPSQTMEGFFVAKLRKLEPTVTAEALAAPAPFSRKSRYRPSQYAVRKDGGSQHWRR